MDRIDEAIYFATATFKGKTRKCENHPAIFHSLEAACIAQSLTDDEDTVIAALLHDTVEDAEISLFEIKEKFGARVAELVNGETENKRENKKPSETWQIRKREAIDFLLSSNDIGLKIVFLSDKLSNVRSLYRSKLKFGDSLWQMFHQNDPQAHYWYYSSIAHALTELNDTVAYKEYIDLINKTFAEE